MKKGKKLYEGKAKIIYSTSDKNLVIQYFKDDATAFNNEKRTTIEGKGVLNNRISEHILTNLSQIGIENHLVKRLNMREQLIKFVEIIPIEFVIRNVATGSLTKRLGIEDGTVLKEPLIEYCLKDDKLGDPLISEDHIYAFDWANKKEIEKIKKELKKIINQDVKLNVVEVKQPDLDAQLVADSVTQQLEKRIMFRKAMKRAVQNTMRQGAKGIRIEVSGRLNGAEIARSEWYREGRVPLHTLKADIDYATSEALTTYGILGVKVWIYRGDKGATT